MFLDRDGVLSIPEFRDGRSFAPKFLDDFVLYEDAAEGVAVLKRAGFLVIVATNQPDVGAGLVPRETVEAMHERLSKWTEIDDIEVSYETREQDVGRRKPAPGMLLDAAKKWEIDLSASYMVGDRSSDVECGFHAGCHSVFIDRHYSVEPIPEKQIATVSSLAEAVGVIVSHSGKSTPDAARFI
ncbi:HAD-IIIA family hydrolase [Rhodospirillaceae bacterium KN72]|uniref:D,D-heptose 1,7-bisphosphate phosphatase n=1 Tax=Pacificispira spongiicola TaxID=2729598 RepID=A0A7Y0HI89_9PROT|nr:HAD-IIIA family hydrolase [Pacificispira spongiicola]NMM46732.1 HAD-IIIA family hydrolase [Pacificispira spongiicola]